MRPYRFLIKPWVISAVMVLVLLFYFYIDKQVTLFFQQYLNENFHYFDNIFNHLWQGILVMPVMICIILFCRYILKNTTWFYRMSYLFYILLVGHFVLSILKFILGRARPYLLIDKDIFGFFPMTLSYDYFSFPSGHTMVIMTIAGFATLLIKSPWRYVVIALGLMCSFSRVWQNLHHLSDWFFSAYLTLCLFPLATMVLDKFLPKKYMQTLNKAMLFSA